MTITVEAAPAPAKLSLEERQAILAPQVAQWSAKGWTVLSMTQTQASLTKGKNTSHGIHIFLSIITVGLWIPVWILISILGGQKSKLLTVNEYGFVTTS